MAVNSVGYQPKFGQEQTTSSSPLVPALLVGGATAAGVKFLDKGKEMTQDVFEKQIKSGAEIKYTADLTAQEKTVADSLKKYATATETAKEGAKTTAAPAGISEKELKGIFGKKEELTPNQYIQKRHHTNIASLSEKIKTEEAALKKTGTLAADVKTAQTNVNNAQDVLTKMEEFKKAQLEAKEAAKLAKAKDATKEVKAAAKKSATTANKAKTALDSSLAKAGIENGTGLGPVARKNLKDAQKVLADSQAAFDKQATKVSGMKADLDLAKKAIKEAKEATKAAGKGAKAIKAKISKSSVGELLSKVTEGQAGEKIAKAFETLKGKLPKVKPTTGKIALFGAIAAAGTYILGKMAGGSKQA